MLPGSIHTGGGTRIELSAPDLRSPEGGGIHVSRIDFDAFASFLLVEGYGGYATQFVERSLP